MSERRVVVRRPQISRGALYLLIATAAVSLVFLLAKDDVKYEMVRWLAATDTSIWSDFKLWQLVTSPLLEVEFIGLIFQAFMLWFFLPALERWWGTKRFLLFALYTSVVGVIAGTLVGVAVAKVPGTVAIVGLDPFIFGGIVAYGVLFADQQVKFFSVLPMTGKQMMIGICAVVGLLVVLGQRWGDGAAMAAAMLLAWLMASGRWTPKLWWLKRKQKRIRKKLKVVRGGDDKKWLN